MSEPRKFKWVGTRPLRHDGVDKVTGRANYGADFSLPGMLFGKILRSVHAHARISGIDASKALALEGVKAVVTSADFPELALDERTGPTNLSDLSRNVMARDKVLYHGHAIAAVAATSPRIAEEALGLIEVDYQPLPHVLDVRAAMAPDACQGRTPKTTRTDCLRGLKSRRDAIPLRWRSIIPTVRQRSPVSTWRLLPTRVPGTRRPRSRRITQRNSNCSVWKRLSSVLSNALSEHVKKSERLYNSSAHGPARMIMKG